MSNLEESLTFNDYADPLILNDASPPGERGRFYRVRVLSRETL